MKENEPAKLDHHPKLLFFGSQAVHTSSCHMSLRRFPVTVNESVQVLILYQL